MQADLGLCYSHMLKDTFFAWRGPNIHVSVIVFLLLLFVCVEVLQPSQHNGVMSSEVSLPNHTFTGQA